MIIFRVISFVFVLKRYTDDVDDDSIIPQLR